MGMCLCVPGVVRDGVWQGMSLCPTDRPFSAMGAVGDCLGIQGPVFMEKGGERECVYVLGISIS